MRIAGLLVSSVASSFSLADGEADMSCRAVTRCCCGIGDPEVDWMLESDWLVVGEFGEYCFWDGVFGLLVLQLEEGGLDWNCCCLGDCRSVLFCWVEEIELSCKFACEVTDLAGFALGEEGGVGFDWTVGIGSGAWYVGPWEIWE